MLPPPDCPPSQCRLKQNVIQGESADSGIVGYAAFPFPSVHPAHLSRPPEKPPAPKSTARALCLHACPALVREGTLTRPHPRCPPSGSLPAAWKGAIPAAGDRGRQLWEQTRAPKLDSHVKFY